MSRLGIGFTLLLFFFEYCFSLFQASTSCLFNCITKVPSLIQRRATAERESQRHPSVTHPVKPCSVTILCLPKQHFHSRHPLIDQIRSGEHSTSPATIPATKLVSPVPIDNCFGRQFGVDSHRLTPSLEII